MSGPRLSGFREGWAIPIKFPMTGTAHYFRRSDIGYAEPACHVAPSMKAGGLLGPGSFPRCRLCERALRK